jgi:hypothetical protein
MADLESLNLQITADVSKAQKSIDALIKTLDRLKQATKGGCGLSAVADGMKKVSNSSRNMSTSNATSAKSFVNLGAKITAAYIALKKTGQVIASWIKESNDYVENLNLFTVAMGEYAGSAKQYAEEVGDLMGIDPSAWMRNQGVFMTLASGFGVATDRAATMSQQLTQLGYDISSFYNIDVNSAMTKLQSGLAGELEPLRRLGYDLSMAKLEATALSLGIDKSVASMTQAEKAELRYYAIMTQVTVAQGDMARTLDAPANQLRVLSAQATQAARALGDLFIPALNAILPVAIAVLRVITSLAKIIARLFGANVASGSISGGMGDLATNAGSASEEIDKATGSAKKLRKTLLGIDELNVMADKNSGSGSGADDLGGGGFDFELPTYDFIGDLTETRVAKIVEDMMEWLGITEDIDSWSELLDTRFGTILKTVGAIGVALGTWKIGTGIYAIFTLFQNSGIVKFFGDVAFAIGAVAAKAATLGEAITYVFSGAAGIISGVATAIVGLFNYVTNLISMLRDGESVSNVLGAALGGLTTAAGGFLIAIGVGATVATGGIVALIIGIVAAVGMLTAVIINHWDEIKAAVGTAWTWLYDTVLSPIVDWFSGVATWFKDHVITPIVEFFRPVVKAIIDMAVLIYTRVKEIITGVIAAIGAIFSKIWEIFLKVVEIAVALGNAFYTYVIQPVVDFIVSIAVWVYEHAIKPIVNFFAKAGTWLYDTIITPVLKGINWLKDQAVALFTSIGTTVVEFVSGAFKAVINGILSTVEKTINGFIKMLNGAIELINKIPGVSITKVSLLSIPRLAEGGVVNEGQMFIAREAGPEMVGSIGNRTAVVNNDQIVESVSRGVYQAVVSAMGQSGGAQVVEAKVNDKVLFEVIVDRNRRETIRTGASPLLGGV